MMLQNRWPANTNKLHTDTITITRILLFYDPTELKNSECIAQANKTGVFLCITINGCVAGNSYA